ncbi:alpha/beta hydrolase [Sanguibacter sp. 25GB23B1]|uniref:alpha/beta fold hydrolase n=1 Tax=unclassified Sanguibacter TaxID=2645534 RepID=UPI0032AF27DD
MPTTTIRPDVTLWFDEHGPADAPPLLLVMGAASSGLYWPDALVARLAEQHRVVRYDHRDTGASTHAFADQPYALRDLADDAVLLPDALGISDAHVVGMSMGGTLTQLLLLDHPDRLRSATVFSTGPLGRGTGDDEGDDADDTPGIDPRLLEMWSHADDPRDREEEIAWRTEHWRLLNGDEAPFDAEEIRATEERVIAHEGRHDAPLAHALADQSGLARGDELSAVTVPLLVVEAPRDPVYPPPNAQRIAGLVPGARLVSIPSMGHALPPTVLAPLAEAILSFTRKVDGG